jgi:uncharacterized protein YuzE
MEKTEIKEIYKALPYLKNSGAEHLWFDYDKEADVLYISFQRPQRATYTDIMDDGTLVHTRESKVVGLTITNFSKRQ